MGDAGEPKGPENTVGRGRESECPAELTVDDGQTDGRRDGGTQGGMNG